MDGGSTIFEWLKMEHQEYSPFPKGLFKKDFPGVFHIYVLFFGFTILQDKPKLIPGAQIDILREVF